LADDRDDPQQTRVQTIKNAWRKGKVILMLCLDIKGAFPSIDIKRLIHNMCMMEIPEEHAEWMLRRLHGQRTVITFDDFRSAEMDVDNGLDQGDPLSRITYIIYNLTFMKCIRWDKGEREALFIDDVYLLMIGDSFTETHAMRGLGEFWSGQRTTTASSASTNYN
jgi:hypothetical protein